MSLQLFVRLASDPAFCAAVAASPDETLQPLGVAPLHQRLLQVAALRLQSGALPPVCAYWFPAPPLPVSTTTGC
jgi:hypothetical protein